MTATNVSKNSNPESGPIEKPKIPFRLEFLDGIRGLAALYVVLFHCVGEVEEFDGTQYPRWLRLALHPLNLGHYSVCIFIVLSGYCLMLPVVQREDKRLKGGFRRYIFRRAGRILPPYYAAPALTLVLMLLVPATRSSQATMWLRNENAFSFQVIGSHILIAHNLRPDWALGIDAPMWSVATEWQIYFVFALLLLPVWRRFGNLALLLCGWALGLILGLAFPYPYASLWFIGLFAFGMAAATRLGKTDEAELRRWGVVAIGAAALLAALSLATHLRTIMIQSDCITGIFTASLIIYCAGRAGQGRNLLLRALESKTALTLGVFSYSLYLIHYPILSTIHLATNALHLSVLTKLFIELTLGVGLSLVAGYVFYLLVERPSLRRIMTAAKM